jgi:hypothetical protein
MCISGPSVYIMSYMSATSSFVHPCASLASPMHSYYLCIIFIHIGLEEGRPLVEYVVEKKGNPQEQQPGEGEQDPEQLIACPHLGLLNFSKGKPQSILSLLCFINTNLSLLCLMH